MDGGTEKRRFWVNALTGILVTCLITSVDASTSSATAGGEVREYKVVVMTTEGQKLVPVPSPPGGGCPIHGRVFSGTRQGKSKGCFSHRANNPPQALAIRREPPWLQ